MTRARTTLLALLVVAVLVAAWALLRVAGPAEDGEGRSAGDAISSAGTESRTPRVRAANGASESDEDAEPTAEADKPPAARKPPARFVVRVVAQEDDTPIAGASVVHAGDDTPPAVTDAGGDATVAVPMTDEHPDAADRWFEVSAPGRVRNSVRATAASGAEQRETVRLAPGFAVEGRVHDAAGNPIRGVHVVAAQGGFCMRPLPEVAEATSDAEGRFRVDGLPFHSSVEFTLSKGGYVKKVVRRAERDASPLDVELVQGDSLSGVVRGPDGTPVGGAQVWAKPEQGEDAEPLPDGDALGDVSDARGEFVIRGLPPRRQWALSATHDEFMDSEVAGPFDLRASRAGRNGAGERVEEAEVLVDLKLRPLARVTVDLEFAAQHDPATAALRFSTGDELPSCAVPGRAEVLVRTPGRFVVEGDVAGLRPEVAVTEVAPGETKTVRLRFEAGASLAGVVVDDTGASIEGAKVLVDADAHWPRNTTTAADGTFAVTGLAVGPHDVCVQAPLHGKWSASGVGAPGDALRCVLPRHGTAALRLRLPDGAPRPARRSIHWNDYPNTADDDGPWTEGEIVQSLPPGSYIVDVEVEDCVKWERHDVEVLPGRRTDLGEIALDRGLRFTGRLLDPEGRPVPWVDLFFDHEITETDAAGGFRSSPLAAGSHEVTVPLLDGYLDPKLKVALAADTPPLEIRLQRGTRLEVRLTGPSAEALEGLEVFVDPPDRAPDADHGTFLPRDEPPGKFAGRVPSGRRTIAVVREVTVVATRDVDLREGGEATVEIPLGK
jgi:carboxypeptidase family protein